MSELRSGASSKSDADPDVDPDVDPDADPDADPHSPSVMGDTPLSFPLLAALAAAPGALGVGGGCVLLVGVDGGVAWSLDLTERPWSSVSLSSPRL